MLLNFAFAWMRRRATVDNHERESLCRRIDALQAEAEEARRLRTQLEDAHKANAASQRVLEKLNKAVEGLEHLVRRKRVNAPDHILHGAEVLVSESGVRGKVSGTCIDRGGVSYWVVWWVNGQRFEELLDGTEVTEIDPDVLPEAK